MADTSVDAIRFLRDTAIAAGTDLGERIYMSFAPQTATYPLAIMNIVSRVPSPTQDSGSAVDEYRVQVDVFAKNTTTSGFETASEIANELREAWSRTTDELSYDHAISGVQEQGHFTEFDPELSLFQVSNDYIVRVTTGGAVMAQIIKVNKTPVLWSDLASPYSAFTLPAGAIIHWVIIEAETVFSGGVISACQLTVGKESSTALYHSGADVFSATNIRSVKTNTATFDGNEPTPIYIVAVPTGGTVSDLEAGQANVWIYYSIPI